MPHGRIDERDEPRRYIALHTGSKREPDPAEADRLRDEYGPPVVVEPQRIDISDLGDVEIYALTQAAVTPDSR